MAAASGSGSSSGSAESTQGLEDIIAWL